MARLWSNNNFRTLWAGQLVSTVGNNLYYLALPWYVLTLTGSRADLVLTGLALRLPALASLVVGVFVDRWAKKPLMIAADAARLVLAGCLGWAAAVHAPFGALLAGVVLFELAGTVFSPAESALLPLVVPAADIAAAEGVQQSSAAVAGLAGKLLGGPLLTVLGAPLLFLTNAASFVVSLISLLGIRVYETSAPSHARASFRNEWMAGRDAIRQSPGLSGLVWSGLLVNFGASALTIVLTTWVKTGDHGTAILLSIASGAFLAGAVVGGIAFGPLARRSSPGLPRWTTLGFALAIGVMGVLRDPAWTIGCMGAAGLCDALFNSWVGTYLVQETPAALRGRVFSTFSGLMLATGPLGLVVFGTALAAGLSLPLLFAMMGAFAAAASLTLRVNLPRGLLEQQVHHS
jgi:MFS family permease